MSDIDILGIIVLTIGFIGYFLITVSFLPLTWELLKNRQTYSFSMSFGISMILSGFFWIIYAFLLMNSNLTENDILEALIKGLPLLITNIVRVISHSINVYLKIKMILIAKKLNLSEKNYCDIYYKELKYKKKL